MLFDMWDSVNHRLNVFIQNATLAVTQSGNWVLAAGSAIIGSVKVTDGTNTMAVKAGSTAAVVADPAAVIQISPNSPSVAVTQASPFDIKDSIGVSILATAKGTQATSLLGVQEAKDSGRVIKTYRAINFTSSSTEALITLTPSADGTDGSTGTTFAVTAGKRLRLTSLTIVTKNAGAAVQGVIVRLRVNPSGAALVTSPVQGVAGAGTFIATTNVVGIGTVQFPDGIELSGTMQLAISQIGTATAGNDVELVGFEY
jgi:hypothetical protein